MAFSPLFIDLLTEANVFNGQDIVKYLEGYARNLKQPQSKQLFVKKISRFLMNDERYLYAMRELPADAPDWAKQASAKGELMKFVPDADLNDKVEHLSHYMAALEQDMGSNVPDTKAVATREYQGIANVGSFDIMIQKSNEYFKRGSRAAGKEISGMEEIMTTTGGYTWYKLVTVEAYKREGKVLQNCIGQVYLPSAGDGTKIYVMKDPQGNTSVAMRVVATGMQEVKGKQNQPPVAKYMPAVQEFINKLGIKVNSGGMHDIQRTGYIWHEDKLYTKEEAIQKFVDAKSVGTIPEGDVVQVSSPIPTLLDMIYGSGGYGGGHKTIFELRKGNKPFMFAMIDPKANEIIKFERISRLSQIGEAAESSIETTAANFVTYLLQSNRAQAVTRSVANDLYTSYNLIYDERKKTVKPLEADEVVDAEDKSTSRRVYKKDAPNVATRLYTIANPYDYNSKDPHADKDPAVNVHHIRSRKTDDNDDEQDDSAWIVQRKSGGTSFFEPSPPSNYGFRLNRSEIGFSKTGEGKKRMVKKVNTIVNLANEKQLKLPTFFKINHGIIQKDGKYQRVSLKPTSVDKTLTRWDLSELSTFDRLAAIHAIANDLDDKTITGNDNFGIGRTFYSNSGRDDDTHASHTEYKRHETHVTPVTDENVAKKIQTAYGAIPDSIIQTKVKYGANKEHEVKMLMSGKNVIAIDAPTLIHSWQGWSDYKNVVDQLNKFADDNGFRYDKKALSAVNAANSAGQTAKEFSVTAGGRLLTKQEHLAGKLTKKGVAQEEVKLEDGTSFTRMGAEELAEWSRTELSVNLTTKDEGWIMKGASGQEVGRFIVKDGRFKHFRMTPAAAGEEGTRDQRGTLAQHLNIHAFLKSKKSSSIHSTDHRLTQYRAGGRHDALDKGLYKINANKRGMLKSSVLSYIGAQALRALDAAKFITRTPAVGDERISLTPEGLAFYNRREERTVLDHIKLPGIVSHDVVAPPPREKAQTKYKISTATPKSGSKAELALQAYTDMVADGTQPTRGDFIRVLTAPPFNMSAAGAQTYYYTTKAKYLAAQGAVNEHTTFRQFLLLM